MFRGNVYPSSSDSRVLFGLLGTEEIGKMIFRNLGNYWLVNRAPHPRSL